MDETASLRALQKAREEVILSREWEEVNRALLTQFQHLEYLQGGGRLRDFVSFSHRDKLAALAKATQALEKTREFSEFRLKVFHSIDRHFSHGSAPEEPDPGVTPNHQTDIPDADNVIEACTQLLHQWPQLTHKLKKCINHPLPPKLRVTAWGLLLQNPTVRQHFIAKVMVQGGLPELTAEDHRLSHRCEALLRSNSLFREIADSAAILQAMKSTVLYWKLKSEGNTVSDKELLLCIPFLYVRREELSLTRASGEQVFWGVVAEVVEEYITFMEMLPLSMHRMDHALEAMSMFSQQLEDLLLSEDKQLHRALTKVFGCPRHHRAPSAVSQEAQLPFHKRLRNLIHPHMQRMLVGDVSMDVLCYIWDQCFIGFATPDYQCLPYFIATWLILLREQILMCRTVTAIEQALTTHSPFLQVYQFQEQIEKRFLLKMSSCLGVTPVRLHPAPPPLARQPAPPPIARQPATNVPRVTEQPAGEARLQARLPESPPVVMETNQREEPEPTTEEPEPATGEYRAVPQGDTEREILKGQIDALQRQLQEQQKVLTDQLTEERAEHQREMKSLVDEVRQLNQTVSQGIAKAKSQASTSTGAISSVPTNMTLLSPDGNTAYVISPQAGGIGVMSPQGNSVHTLPVFSIIQQHPAERHAPQPSASGAGGSPQPSRPYSPSHLTDSQVQDIWLKILSRFTSAAYTVCHGSEKDKQKLFPRPSSTAAE